MRKTVLFCLLAAPGLASAQTPPAAAPAPSTTAPKTTAPAAPATGTQQAAPGAVPLPTWFVEIDTAKKGEVSRADFLKFRMKSFDELDGNKDGKVSLDEYLKLAEPPFSTDVPGGPSLEERRNRVKAEFQNVDTDRSGFVERGEAEALVHPEFNSYDVDRDNRITEAEIRMVVQRALQQQEAQRQQAEGERRKGLVALNDLIDMQMRDADKLDKDSDARITQQEYLVLAGPADGPQAKDLLPYDVRKQLVLMKFQSIDTNKDGIIDRPELTAYALKEFLDSDANKDRFLDQEEVKKFQEAEGARMRDLIPKLMPAQQAAPRPAPQPQRPQQAPAPAAPAGLPQGTR